jgi:hypothetical protein
MDAWKKQCLIFILGSFLGLIKAAEPNIEGSLTFTSLNKPNIASYGNASTNGPNFFSLLTARSSSGLLLEGRQVEECPPGEIFVWTFGVSLPKLD